jgi:hypothetical protein
MKNQKQRGKLDCLFVRKRPHVSLAVDSLVQAGIWEPAPLKEKTIIILDREKLLSYIED